MSSFHPSPWQHLRFEILKRDNFTCQYCGKHPPQCELELDHIKPRSSGGDETDERNIITACKECNGGKWYVLLSDRLPSFAEILTKKGRALKRIKKMLKEIERIERDLEESKWDLMERMRKLCGNRKNQN